MRRQGHGSVVLLAAELWLQPAGAQAQTQPPPADSPAARAIISGQQGVQAYEQGKWTEALEHFREAEAFYHSPVFALFAARSRRQLGQLLEARAALQRLVDETLAPSAPAPWVKARADARLELAELAAEVPTVTLAVEGGSSAAQVSLDDRAAETGRPLELNPGQHRAVVTDGARRREISFNVIARSHPSITLSFAPDEASKAIPAPHQPRSAPAPHAPPAAPRDRGPYLPGWILAGTGAAALAAGGVVGILALNEASKQRDRLPPSCEGQRCLASDRAVIEDRFKSSENLALASDILWISGAVLATTGVALIVIDPRSKTASLSLGGRF